MAGASEGLTTQPGRTEGAPDPLSSQAARALPQMLSRQTQERAVWAALSSAGQGEGACARGTATARTPGDARTSRGEATAAEEGPRSTEHLLSRTSGSWRLAEPCSRPGRPGQEGLPRQLPPYSPSLLLPRGANIALGGGGSRGQSCSAVLGRGCASHGEGNELGTELKATGPKHKRQGLGHGWSQHPPPGRAAQAWEWLPATLLLAGRAAWPCRNAAEGWVSLGCPLGRQRRRSLWKRCVSALVQ